MSIRDTDLLIAAIAAGVGEHAGGYASQVGLEGQNHHVHHQPDMFGVFCRDAGRPREIGRALSGRVSPVHFQPAFDLSD